MQITYTSKLSESVAQELELMTQKLNTTKRAIIEKALNQYFEQIKKAEYIASFKRANGDLEVKELSEMGLEDFLIMLEE